MKRTLEDIFEPEMPVVPPGWDVLPFEQAVDVVSDKGKRVKQGAYLLAGRIPVIDQGQDTIGGYTDDEDMAFDDELPVILFGDHTRSLKYVDRRFAVGAEGVKILRPREGYVPKFFYYLLRSLQIPSRGYSRHFQFLRKFHLLHAPEVQQQRIVAEIEKQFSRLDEAVASLKRTKAKFKRYKAGVLKAAIDGKLAPTAGPWKQVALGDVTTSIRNGYSKKPDAEQGTRIFRISAVRPMKLDANDVRYLSGTPADYEPFLVEPGDVLFTRYNGNRDYVGVCARVPLNLPPTIYPDKLIRVRVPRLMMLPEFLVILASTGHAREYIESKIRTTAGQSGISGGDLKVLPLDIPRMEEQLQIVAEVERRLSVIEDLEATVEANFTRADRLRQSILGQAFSGKLLFNGAGG